MQPQPYVPDSLRQYCPLTGFDIFWRIVSPLLPFVAIVVALAHEYVYFMRHEPVPVKIVIAVVYLVVTIVLWKIKAPWWGKTLEDHAKLNVGRNWLVLKRATGSSLVTRDIMQTAAVRGICFIHGTSYVALPLCPPDAPRGFVGFVTLDPDLRQDLEGVKDLNQSNGLRHWELCLDRFNADKPGASTVWVKHWESQTWTLFTVVDLLEFAASGLPDRYEGQLASNYLAIIIRVYRGETERLRGGLERVGADRDRQAASKRSCLDEVYRCWRLLLPLDMSSEPEASRKGRHAIEDFLLSQLPDNDTCRCEIGKYVAEDPSRRPEREAAV